MLFAVSLLFADSTVFSDKFWEGVLGSLVFGVIALVLLVLTYKLFDKLLPDVHIGAELQKGNLAVALFMGSVIVGMCYVIGQVVR